MRVIAGKARRLQLKTPQGKNTRPTTDRIKETLFNMLQEEIADINFLDLFSGSGAIGIEALSRGARRACFVEQDRMAAEIIRQNLVHTQLDQQAEIYNCTALTAIRQLQEKMRFHVVFMDPPYGKGLEAEVLADPAFYRILEEHALIIVEADLHTELCAGEERFHILKEKIYKTNKHIFLERI